MFRFHRAAVLLCAALFTTSYALADQPTAARSPSSFGTSFTTVLSISSTGFTPLDSSDGYTWNGTGSRWATSGTGYFAAPVPLPSGVLITALEIQGCDTSATGGLTARLFQSSVNGTSEDAVDLLDAFSGNAPAPGCSLFVGDAPSPITINSNNGTYWVLVQQNDFGSSLRFQGVRIRYKLQVSPAPAVATFGDVPTTYLYFRAIEALAASGIAAGCGNGNFCPDQPVTRGELAKFLANAVGLFWKD